jgi:hypothetical protein
MSTVCRTFSSTLYLHSNPHCAIGIEKGTSCEERLKFTWYISSPRADNCSSVLPAANNVLKVYRAKVIRMSGVKSMKILYSINSSVEGN